MWCGNAAFDRLTAPFDLDIHVHRLTDGMLGFRLLRVGVAERSFELRKVRVLPCDGDLTLRRAAVDADGCCFCYQWARPGSLRRCGPIGAARDRARRCGPWSRVSPPG